MSPQESDCSGKATTRGAGTATARPGQKITRPAVIFVPLFSNNTRSGTDDRARKVMAMPLSGEYAHPGSVHRREMARRCGAVKTPGVHRSCARLAGKPREQARSYSDGRFYL